jgi:hypothetical protein
MATECWLSNPFPGAVSGLRLLAQPVDVLKAPQATFAE